MHRDRSSSLARLRDVCVALLACVVDLFRPTEKREPIVAPSSRTIVLAAGEAAPGVAITAKDSNVRLRQAFAETVAGRAGIAGLPDIVWVDGDNELLVRPSRMRVVFEPGFVLIGISVYTKQTGDVEIVIPFALGQPDEPLGLLAATEPLPRGPASIVDTWADPLIAAAWEALLKVVTAAAAAVGVDDEHERLLPAALTVGKDGLMITPQARHAFDRRR